MDGIQYIYACCYWRLFRSDMAQSSFKVRSTLATMSKQHCRTCNFVACCFDNVAVLGNNVEATFNVVESTTFQRKTRSTLLPFLATKSNVALTLLLVWTGLKLFATAHCATWSSLAARALLALPVRGRPCSYIAEGVCKCFLDSSIVYIAQNVFN